MEVRKAASRDLDHWAHMRAHLWPEASATEHRKEIEDLLAGDDGNHIAYMAIDAASKMHAFAEASLRHDYVNGCETSPVAFLEGIYVAPEDRRLGLGRLLLDAVQSWAVERGCMELASDALIENVDSHAFHDGLGFEETERVVFFRKRLGSS